jgi:ATP-binding cassette subfamily C protein CydD
VTGPSGAGKSTLLTVLLRFTEPTSGHTSFSDVPVDEWREQIAWVSQNPCMFAATIADNIRLGAEASIEEVRRAARLAGAAEFIEELPEAYDTDVGEHGLRLSAGQRQRIALARAFLRDAPLLLLDEPAAHLDPVTAGQILDAVERLMAGRTAILVSHGVRWPGGADRALTLDGGRVVLAAGCLPALEVTR